MQRFLRKFLRYFLVIFLLLTTAIVFSQPGPADGKPLVVGVAGSAPFVIDSGRGSGISIEIWQAVASELGWQYQKKHFADVPAALNALTAGEVDIVVGPVSITSEREKSATFTQPYFQSGLSILSKISKPTFSERLGTVLNARFLTASFILIFILSLVGFLLWAAEKKVNPGQFHPNLVKGVGDGMWCALVTMTTTGYGDKAPITRAGRVITAGWMIISIIFATSMIAGISSALTLSGLDRSVIASSDQLEGKNIAIVKGSPAEHFVSRHGAKIVSMEQLHQGYDLLKHGDADAVVFDRPQMQFFLKEHPDKSVVIAATEYVRKGYGFALPLHSRLQHEIDIAILQLQESGRMQRIINAWLIDEDE